MALEFFDKEKFKNKFGIYAIVNKETKKIYIGSTNRTFNKRFNEHNSDLRKGKHCNQYLQNDFNKTQSLLENKLNNFIFFVIETIEENNNNTLLTREQEWLDVLYDEQRLCYNFCKDAGTCYGIKLTEEHKRNIGNALKGKKKSKEHLQKIVECAKINKKVHFKSGKDNIMFGRASSRRRKVNQICLDTNTVIATHNSIKEAAIAVNINSYVNIVSCCAGRKKSAGGFRWEYTNNQL